MSEAPLPLAPLATLPARSPLFSLRGRLGRVEFIAYGASSSAVGSLALSALGLIFMAAPGMGRVLYPAALSLVVNVLLPLLLATFAVRRLHDIGRPGWLVLLLLVPVANLFVVAALALWPGSREPNGYGPPRPAPSPRARAAAVALPLLFLAIVLASEPFTPIESVDGSTPAAGIRRAERPPATAPDTLRSYRP